MANLHTPERQNQVRALVQLSWSLRRIQFATGLQRNTVRS
jgi:hypothetical protein